MNQIHNPPVPYNAPIPGGVTAGKVIRIHGSVPHHAQKFAVNLLCGHSGDIALHVSPHMHSRHVVRNSVQHMNWGHEEKHGGFPIHPGQGFELIILCEHHQYKIAFNGVHFTEFNHRIPLHMVTNLAVDGEVSLTQISYDGQSAGGNVGGFVGAPSVPYNPSYGGHHQTPGITPYQSTGAVPYPPQVSGVYPPPQHGGVYPSPHVHPGAAPYPTQPGYPAGVHLSPHSQQHPYYPHSPTGHKKTGLLDKAGMAVAGALGASALMGGSKYNKLGGLAGGGAGGVLGAGLAGAALTGHLNPKKAMKKQAKAQKKALKYGLPIAGVGLGAYALHKGMHKIGHHHHHRSSSSSSSSSSD